MRDISRSRDLDLKNVRLVGDPQAVVDDPAVAIVVEAIGGTDPATALIESALRAGKTVVTANKAVIAASGPRLSALAAEHGARLYFEATVGAGLPIIALLRDSLLGDRISALDCVINGTTNVILTQMRSAGVTFESALADAQRRGFAEADPSLDVDGWDAVHKLVILAWLASVFTSRLMTWTGSASATWPAPTWGARSAGYRVRLLAHAERARGDAVHLRVRPTAVGPGHLLHDVDDADNAVIISSDLEGTVTLRGLGAGGASTASAVVSDVVNAVRERPRRRWSAQLRDRAPPCSATRRSRSPGTRLRLSAEPKRVRWCSRRSRTGGRSRCRSRPHRLGAHRAHRRWPRAPSTTARWRRSTPSPRSTRSSAPSTGSRRRRP